MWQDGVRPHLFAKYRKINQEVGLLKLLTGGSYMT
jgi:hypothetical protein